MERTVDIDRYFDWAATAPCDADIARETLELSLSAFGNPSSTHSAGEHARTLLEHARADCARTLGVHAAQLYFTSGGTESDHIPLLSVLARQNHGRARILISAIEHPALREQATALARLGCGVDTVLPDKDGVVTPEAVVAKLTGDTVFVAVMAVNNETGCIQPIYAIADAITAATQGKRRPHFHTDCVQAAGKIPLNLAHQGIDSAAFSAHKLCGPRGIGLLYLAKPLAPFLAGGGQEQGIRSGTENLFGALALARCLHRYWISDSAAEGDNARARLHEQESWTKAFLDALVTIDGCTIVPATRAASAHAAQFSPWVVQAAFKDIPGNVMVRALDEKGFAISTGSACSAKKQSRPVLAAMGVARDVQDTAVRFSFGAHTTKAGMDALLSAVREICAALRSDGIR